MNFRLLLLAGLIAVGFSGCQSPASMAGPDKPAPAADTEVLRLRPGDSLKISFPGAPNLDTSQQIRPDGRITMQIIGEIYAAGLTPADLKTMLLERYASQLVTKEVDVQVVSSTFFVYVSGAVMKPGKVDSTRPLSALDAIMEAGGFDNAKADTAKVRVLRNDGGTMKTYVVNLKNLLSGKSTEIFNLKAGDTIFVPDKFTWL